MLFSLNKAHLLSVMLLFLGNVLHKTVQFLYDFLYLNAQKIRTKPDY